MKTPTLALVAVCCAGLCTGLSAPDERTVDRSALWTRDGKDLLHGFRNMYNLHVVDEGSGPFRYRGWMFGWATTDCNRNLPGYRGCDAIFAARAPALDGPWQVWGGDSGWVDADRPDRWRPVFAPQHTAYDGWHNGDPSVVHYRNRYYMAYSSVGPNLDGKLYGEPGDTDGSILCIMGAVSKDGITWERSRAPILLHRPDLGARGISGGEAHLYGSYHRPSLMRDGGKWKLWFDYWAGDGNGLSMGYAENSGDFLDPDAWHVVRADATPALRQFPNPDVVKAGGIYLAYGDPPVVGTHPWTSRVITEAVSRDGLRWAVLGHVRPDPGVPAIHVPEALVQRGKRGLEVHLFYACQIGGSPYDYRYRSIRRMWRRLGPADFAAARLSSDVPAR